MAIFELFSKRAKKERGEVIDVYQYTNISIRLKNQIMMIIDEVYNERNKKFYDIVKILRNEYGDWQLIEGSFGNKYTGVYDYRGELYHFFIDEDNYEKCLDVIELLLQSLEVSFENKKIDEVNFRMLEAGLGYEYSEKQLIKISDKLIHQETVKPAIQFLNEKGFEGAREEFLEAFDDYRKQKYKDSLNKCLKSIESTLKTIFDIKGWEYNKNLPVKALIKVAFDNELIPSFWHNHFSYLDKVLECSVPVGRNKLGSHGQGSEVVEVPEEIISYMLHMTASTIVFLVKASK